MPPRPRTSDVPRPRIVDTAECRMLTSGPEVRMDAAYIFLALHALVIGTGSRSAGL